MPHHQVLWSRNVSESSESDLPINPNLAGVPKLTGIPKRLKKPAAATKSTSDPKKVRRILKPATVVGWREWLQLPELCKTRIKVKVDTGARSSCLHAFNVQVVEEAGQQVVHFDIHPIQNSTDKTVRVTSPLIEYRTIRSSSGHEELRPVIRTLARFGDTTWPIEVTLTNRDQMGFRMLLGRRALAHRFIVNPAKSFVQSRRS